MKKTDTVYVVKTWRGQGTDFFKTKQEANDYAIAHNIKYPIEEYMFQDIPEQYKTGFMSNYSTFVAKNLSKTSIIFIVMFWLVVCAIGALIPSGLTKLVFINHSFIHIYIVWYILVLLIDSYKVIRKLG